MKRSIVAPAWRETADSILKCVPNLFGASLSPYLIGLLPDILFQRRMQWQSRKPGSDDYSIKKKDGPRKSQKIYLIRKAMLFTSTVNIQEILSTLLTFWIIFFLICTSPVELNWIKIDMFIFWKSMICWIISSFKNSIVCFQRHLRPYKLLPCECLD